MGSLLKAFLLSGLMLPAFYSFCQLPLPVQQLEDYCKMTAPTGFSPRLSVLTLTPKGNLHYLFPFYHAFRDKDKFVKTYTLKGYYDELSQYFAFAGDYQRASCQLSDSTSARSRASSDR